MISNILIILGVAVLCIALRCFRHPIAFRLSTVGIVVTLFLLGWLLGGSLAAGFVCAASWLFLPWLEILTRVRRLRLPVERTLVPRTPPTRNVFPGFSEITEEVEAEGFEYVEDTGWDYEDNRQFYRLFCHPRAHTEAAICLVEQNEFAFYYLMLTTRASDGRVFMTWNYPFSYGLSPAPRLKLNRISGELSFAEIAKKHEEFLTSNHLSGCQIPSVSPKAIRDELQNDLRAQIMHNIDKGLLKRDDHNLIRYSVRGMFYLWFQFLRDIVRIS